VIGGLIEGGVLPVIKHIPGHGRAGADTHLELPHVTATRQVMSESDFVAFRSLATAPLAMTAHVVYDAIDPNRPATTSPRVIHEVIRGEIGYQGLLMTDDLSMQALSGPISARAKAALFAGCDVVLHCNGKMEEMKAVMSEMKPLEGEPLKRAEVALGLLTETGGFDSKVAEARLNELLAA
jgi:beta-N-acetylhexosaminidase